MKRTAALALLLVLILAGCGQGGFINLAGTATPVPSATATEWPTPYFPPTSTPLSSPTPRPTTADDEFAFAQNKRLGRGVNFGNALEAPQEGEWDMVLEEAYFDLVKEGGFNSIRVPIRWDTRTAPEAPYTIDPAFFERVDWVVDQAVQRDLMVILDNHHYNEEIHQSTEKHVERLTAIWRQVAQHYQDAPDSVLFEIINEPNGTLSNTDALNNLYEDIIGVIRQSNPKRTIIVGPGNWNNIYALAMLALPEAERNLIVTFHYYSPFQFTHQGAEWVADSEPWMGTTWDGKSWEQEAVTKDFDTALLWAQKNARPMFLGEFGAYSKADAESRERWTAFVAREAEQRGFAWAYWEFGAGFGVYDRQASHWVEPIKRALIP